MTIPIRPQQSHLSWPWTASQVEDLDTMIQTLFKRVAALTRATTDLTEGSVVFAGSNSLLSEDNSRFFWDDANSRLGIGTSTPSSTLDVNGTATIDIPHGTSSVRGLQIIRTEASSVYGGLEKAIWVPGLDGNENYGFTVNAVGAVYTGAWVIISGVIGANGLPQDASDTAGLSPHEPTMLSLVTDIVGPAIQVYSQEAGSWCFSVLEKTTGRHVFNVEANGSLSWGAGARGAEDTTLTRTAAGKLSLTGTTPMFQLGGTSASFPAIKRSSTAVSIRLADDSANAPLIASTLTSSSLTSGRVPFASTGGLLIDSANLFWDAANSRLGIGLTNPQGIFHVFGGIANFDCTDSYFGDRFGATGTYLDIGTLGTSDTWLDARGSAADISMYLRAKGAGIIQFRNGATEIVTMISTGRVGIGESTPTALLHLKAGTASANTAPIKLTSGTSLTSPEAGTIEYDGTNFYLTP